VTDMMELSDNEIFGPVAPLYKFKTEEEVIKMANDTIVVKSEPFHQQF